MDPTKGAARALDTVQSKGLRKTLAMKTTHVDRASANEVVFKGSLDVFRSKMNPRHNEIRNQTNDCKDK